MLIQSYSVLRTRYIPVIEFPARLIPELTEDAETGEQDALP
jgi:hypothetical protein